MRRPSASVAARNEPVMARIRPIKADHPFWGYRRGWAHLRFIDGLVVNQKRVLRLMRQHDLTVKPNQKLKTKRSSTRPKPRPDRPHQWWGIDMTKVMTETGWGYVVIVLDWYSKKIAGQYTGSQATARHWLAAVDSALNRQFPEGVRGHQLHLMSDNGSQPTSIRFMKVCAHLEISQAFTSYNNPKGNADTERMIRTLKEELLWLREWSSVGELTGELNRWIDWYNESYLHSALGYCPPNQVEKAYNFEHETLLQTA
jgi:putative transposase